MSTNPKSIYNEFIRANLPVGITYDEVRAQYVTFNGKRFPTYLQAKWYLDYVTKFGYSSVVTDLYSVAGFSPPLVLDFAEEFYRTGGSTSTFDDALNFTRAGNATMVDSDGVLKWAPHNLLTYSEQFDNGAWSKVVRGTGSAPTVTANAGVAPDGTSTADRIQFNKGAGATSNDYSILAQSTSDWASGQKANGAVWVKSNTSSAQTVLVYIASSSRVVKSVIEVGQDWALIAPDQIEFLSTSIGVVIGARGSATFGGDDSLDLLIWGAHLYRSDHGGMVNNPATGNSYVPTTDSARYLPRVGHHIWNGSAWVDEGYFHESEARIQLLHTTNALVTQSKTVTAVPHTLHFTGTGTVTLSGASTSGPLVGTGTGEENRVSLTFTPTAASLTLTVSGTVTDAQLEVGSTPSSYTPNLAASGEVTRSADAITVPSANLPWPTPNVIGEELVTNGTFEEEDGVDGWSFQTNATGSVVSSELQVTLSSSVQRSVYQDIETEVGKLYVITATARSASGSVLVGAFSTTFSAIATQTLAADGTNKTFSVPFYANATTTRVLVSQSASGSTETYFADNISVREIDPLSVSIQMDGTVTGNTYTPTRWYLDANNAILQDIGSTDFTFTQEAAGVVDTVTGGSFTSGVNTPFNIASRHGSTFINGAVDGVALTANTTPTALPYLENTDLNLAFDYMGTIKKFRFWSDDLGDAGIEEAST